jgi:UDPglucose 6-dehydrogenase
MTEWDVFRGLSLGELALRLRGNALLDLPNVYDKGDARHAGLRHFGSGGGLPS